MACGLVKDTDFQVKTMFFTIFSETARCLQVLDKVFR